MITGIAIGLVFGIALNLWSMKSYKNVLVMKSQDGSAEYINGKFYYIKEEGEIIK